MRLRKGRWEYDLPGDTYEVLYGYMRLGKIDFSLQHVRPLDILHMRDTAMKKNKAVPLGKVAYIAAQHHEDGIRLLTFPTPDKAVQIRLRTTKIVEL